MRREKELLVAKHREEAAKWESEIKNGKKSLQGEITFVTNFIFSLESCIFSKRH